LKHPISDYLKREGLTLLWVSRRTGFHPDYLSNVFNGNVPAKVRLRKACALAVGRPEEELFHSVASVATEREGAAVA